MINEGIELLSRRFTTTVGLQQQPQPTQEATCVVKQKDDLSAIEVFYASTTGTVVSSSKNKTENNMTFVVDKQRSDEETRRRQMRDEDAFKAAREKEKYKYQESLKRRIDQILPADEPETQPLARYLHRHIREKATVERMRTVENYKKKTHQVYYASFSYLLDGIYPMVEGLHKRRRIRSLKQYFKELPATGQPVGWSAGDANKSIVGAIFAPVKTSSMYEDNLQRLFLLPPYDIKETQKLNPRGVLLANMATFAHNHDPLVDIAAATPTTLRGLFSNVLDGTMYKGLTVSSLRQPFEVSDLYEGGDLKAYCDRFLECSYQAVLLTLIGVKAWVSERYPQDRFVVNSKGFVTFKLPYNEVIHDRKDGVWIFNNKILKTICFTGSFDTLLTHMYNG